MNMKIDNHKDLPEYAVAKKVWDDIHNNDTLIYNDFEEYFFDQFIKSDEILQRKRTPMEHRGCPSTSRQP